MESVDGTSQWISLGWSSYFPNESEAENRKILGSFYSPESSGGNFLVSAYWPASKSNEFSHSQIKSALKVWDHQYLEARDFGAPLTLEILAERLWSLLQEELDQQLYFYELQIQKGHSLIKNKNSGLIS